MKELKQDPRLIRTRQSIIEAFIQLSLKKEFSQISVKDITLTAQINRATFYNHFLDKYDLLEKVVSEKLSLNLGCSRHPRPLSLKETIKEVFLALIRFQENLNTVVSAEDENQTIESIVHIELTSLFFKRIASERPDSELETTKRLASLLTHSVTGMSKDYHSQFSGTSPEDYVESLLPYLVCGITEESS
ncbi:TetR/AcrR family transcriptional regulator [Alkalibacterium psychrotolerans]